MTTASINTLTQMIEKDCTQKVTNLSIAQTTPYTTGYILIGTRINFVHNESSTP